MQIEVISGAAANVAPTSESTAASPEAGKNPGSFADLLDAVAEDQEQSSADEADESESPCDEWMSIPVIPFVQVIPQDVVQPEDGDATSIEAIGEDIAADNIDAPLPEVATSSGVKSFVEGEAPKPTEVKQAESSTANETPMPAMPAADRQPVVIDRAAAPEATAADSKIEATTVMAPKDPIAVEPTTKHGKTDRIAPKPNTAKVNEAAKAAAAETINAVTQDAPAKGVSPRAEASSNTTSNEAAPNPKGVAARFAKAIERAAEHAATAQPAATGENNQSSNQGGDGQPSLGEWLREQLPQLNASRGHNVANPAFTFVAPAQTDARVSGLLASSGQIPTSTTPALLNEPDVNLQIVQSMRMQFRDGIGEAVLKLNPEHLGSVSISLKVENGGLKANVQADMPAVRQWLESQQDTLRTALAEHGLRLDQFDVEPDAQRQQADDEGQREQSRKRQAQKREAEQPVFEVVV